MFETLVEDKLEEESTLTSKCRTLIVTLTVLLPVVAEITTSIVFLWVWGWKLHSLTVCVADCVHKDMEGHWRIVSLECVKLTYTTKGPPW